MAYTHFSPENIYGNRIFEFAIPKCAHLNGLYRDQTVPSFNKDSEIKVEIQRDNILDDISMDSEVSFSFREMLGL